MTGAKRSPTSLVIRLAAVVALAASTAAVLLWVATRPTGEFSGWTATPSTAPTTAGSCPRALDDLQGDDLVLISEDRGPFTLELIRTGTDELLVCIHTSAGIAQDPGLLDFVSVSRSMPSDAAWSATLNALDYRGGSVRLLYGKAPNDTMSMTVNPRSHRDVQVSVRDGWFAAWWPTRRYERLRLADVDPHVTLTRADGTTRSGSLSSLLPEPGAAGIALSEM